MTGVRVIRVLGSLDVGGAELRTIDLLPRLAAAGVETHVVALSGRAGALAPQAERLGARVHPMGLDVRFPIRFLRLLWRVRPRVVHSDVATFSGVLMLLAAVGRVPVRIAHFHSDGDGRADTWPRRIQRSVLRRLIDVFATRVIGVSPGALTHGYRSTWESDARCLVVPNGLDTGRLLRDSGFRLREAVGAGPGEIVCLHVGRGSPDKRRWLIPPMVAALASQGIASHAVLVGPRDPADEFRVHEAARVLGIAGRVHVVGARDDVGSLMRQADVVVLPSRREGLPGAVLEAAAVGTPVVASDLPGVRFIAGQLDGVSAVPADAEAPVWAEAIRTARTAPAARDHHAAVTRFRSSAFSLEPALAAYLALYAAAPAPTVHTGSLVAAGRAGAVR